MTLSTRVFNPRGARKDGGGLIAQVLISADEVDNWCRPSAIERARFARLFDRTTLTLRREVEGVLLAEAARRDAQDREVALAHERGGEEPGPSVVMAVDAHDDVPPGVAVEDGGGGRQPVDVEQKKTPASGGSTPSTPAA